MADKRKWGSAPHPASGAGGDLYTPRRSLRGRALRATVLRQRAQDSRSPPHHGPNTIDEYLSRLSDEKRAALERLRKIIRSAAPKAEECISYQIPTFKQNGMLVGFGASANHCTFFLMSTSVMTTCKKDLQSYETGKGSIRFQPDDPLPAALIRKLVKARVAENSR